MYLGLLGDLLGVDAVSQVGAQVAVGVGQRLLDEPQSLVVLLRPLHALLQLLPSQRRLQGAAEESQFNSTDDKMTF